jgi:AcrR family transcriptional regulator
MPSSTFINLPDEKRHRIEGALLNEFSSHSLATAQVARIVKDAQIARGAFYKYFEDLTDAYSYMHHRLAIKLGGRDDMERQHLQTAADYIQRVRDLTDTSGQVRDFFVLHYTANEGLLPDPLPAKIKVMMDDQRWAVMILIHESIKECLVDPENKELILERLERILKVILKEEETEGVSSN